MASEWPPPGAVRYQDGWHRLVAGDADLVTPENFRLSTQTVDEALAYAEEITGAGVPAGIVAVTWGPLVPPTRRRRRFRRRPRSVERWDALSPAYRHRLRLAGITRYRYVRGDSLQAARSHRPPPPPSRSRLPVEARLFVGETPGRPRPRGTRVRSDGAE